MLQRLPRRRRRVQLRQRDRADLLVPETLEVAGVVAPGREEDLECRSAGLPDPGRDGERLEEREDVLELLVDEVGEGKDEALRAVRARAKKRHGVERERVDGRQSLARAVPAST